MRLRFRGAAPDRLHCCLVAFASTPVVARTRLICRYTGLEITDCAEQHIPARTVLQAEGCCSRQVTQAMGTALGSLGQEFPPPALQTFPAAELLSFASEVERERPATSPTGPPLLLVTRALLI